jgi:hypothetical protein
VEAVPAFVGETFHQVNRAVHQRQHVGIGPPVSIAFGGTVAGETEGRTVIQKQDVVDAGAGKVEGGADTRDACAANDNLCVHGLIMS